MADETLPRPADQVAAGGTAQPADAGGILGALRSLGTPPQAALQNIMGPAPNMGSAFGSGVLSALAGNPGQNPYLAAQAQQQKDAFYQQLNAQRLRDQQADRQLRQNEFNLKLADSLLESPDESTRVAGAQAKLRVMQQAGLPATPATLKGMAMRRNTPAEITAAGRYLELFQGDAQKAAALSGVDPAIVAELAKGRGSEAFSSLIYGKSLTERKQAELTLKKTEIDLWNKQHPASPETLAEAALVSQEMFHKPLADVPDDDRVAVLRRAEKNLKAREDADKKRDFDRQLELAKAKASLAQSGKNLENQQVASLAQHKLVLIDAKGNQYTGSPLDTVGTAIKAGYEPVPLSVAKELQGGKYSFQIFSNMRAKAADLAQKGKLASVAAIYEKAAQSSPDYAAARAGDVGAIERLTKYVQYNIGKFTKDPDILQWAGMESEMVIALRGMGDKGLRALGAFQGAMDVMKTGQYDAIDGYIRNLETSSVTQYDEKYKSMFGTSYIVQDKRDPKKVGRLRLAPGEALDLQRYRVMPEFNMPAKPAED